MAHHSGTLSTRHLISSLLTFILLSHPTIAQVGTILDHSKLPNCAFSCQTLLNAQRACVPSGGAPTTNQATYQSCFCQSAYLVQFKSTAIDICSGACTATDLQQIQSWYTSLCSSGVVVTPGGSAATSTSSSGSAATATSKSGTHKTKGTSSQTWIGTHYGWIIMIIILILVGVAGIYGGLWLKHRYQRKDDMGVRETALMVDEAAAALKNRHPESPSMFQLPPSSSRNHGPEFMSGAIGSVGGGRGKGKSMARGSRLREVTDAGTMDEAGNASLGRSGSRPKSKSGSRKSRSRREK